MNIEVLMGIGEKEGQWLMSPGNPDEDIWHDSRQAALADAAQYAADLGKPVTITADSE